MRIRRLAYLAAAIAAASPAVAQDYQAGLTCYELNDFGCAIRHFAPLAQNGMTRAQYRMGSVYAEGTGVPVDLAEAYKWFTLAAAKGDRVSREAIDSITPIMTPDQVQEGLRRARAFDSRRRS